MNEIEHKTILKNKIVYEVNIRQYTQSGTISAFVEHIPKISKLGVGILWIMPIQPIGVLQRKGSLGSYYSIQNYTEVNPELGTKDDFALLVRTAHENNLIVIWDWVANHTSWDNEWLNDHKDWYLQDKHGNITNKVKEWTDIVDLNYNNNEMRLEMIKSMKYWIEQFDIDGFRCDMAMLVPTDFWEQARIELDKTKSVFMLAEAEEKSLMQKAFDANYSWELLHLTEDIAQQKRRAVDLIDYFLEEPKRFDKKVFRLTFTSNHDENSWQGAAPERYPNNSHKAFAVFTYVIPGLPLIYSGQEAELDKRLKFFDKDFIDWKKSDMFDLYEKLAELKTNNPAVWNGNFGGNFDFAPTENNEQIFTFVRQKDNNKLLALFNFSNFKTSVKYVDKIAYGEYIDFFSGNYTSINKQITLELEPWEYKIMINSKS